MKQYLRNHEEVCHVWASRSQESGRCGNISFDDDTIYSYGRHFPMARFYGDNIVLFTTKGHSVSTSTHLGLARQAIPGNYTIFHVPNVNSHSKSTHQENIDSYMNRIKGCWKDYPRARVNKPYIVADSQRQIEGLKGYCQWAKKRVPDYSAYDLNTPENILSVKELNSRLKVEAEKLRVKTKRLTAKAKKLWIDNASNDTFARTKTGNIHFSEILIRLTEDGKEIQSSSGAYAPLKACRVLYKAIKASKPVHGIKIGNYTVTGLNGSLRIGCHEISRKEVDRLAKVLSW